MEEITIREACQEDASAIATILRALGWFAQVNNEQATETNVHIIQRLELCHRDERSHTVLVAERPNGDVIGYVAVHWFPNLRRGIEGYISELFVHPSETGRGIGSRLLQAITRQAATRRCTRLLLVNRQYRESYQRGFYAKQGWKERRDNAVFTFSLCGKDV